MPITFTVEEVTQIKSGQESEELKNKIHEAENLVKFKTLRDSVKSKVIDNADEFIKEQLDSLSIPAGVKEIALTYNLNPETLDFSVLSSGVKVIFADTGSVSEEITTLVTKAEFAKSDRKNAAPLAFIVKSLGDSRISYITSLRDFTNKVKTALDELYTYEEAKALAEGVSEIPQGDKCKLIIKYRHDVPVEGSDKTEAGWLAPNVSVGKTVSSGGGNGGGGQGFRVTSPEGYKSWTEWGKSGVNADAKALYDNAVAEKGTNFQKKVSFSNILKAAKHPVYLEQLEAARSKKEAA